MTYYADLTAYEFLRSASSPGLVNIGWLDGEHTFATGTTSEAFRQRLFEICLRERVAQTRGFHGCSFGCTGLPISAEKGGETLMMGSAEIRVRGNCGMDFATPDMIYHYVVEHSYLPPQVFIEAVLSRR